MSILKIVCDIKNSEHQLTTRMPNEKFQCGRCKKIFPDNAHLNRHLDRKNPCVAVGTPVQGEWTCETCVSTFKLKSNYTAHLKTQLHERMVAKAALERASDHDNPPSRKKSKPPENVSKNEDESIGDMKQSQEACTLRTRFFESVTGIQDTRQDQFYFGFAGPPENWFDVKRSDGTPFVLRPDQLILKFGQHISNSSRNVTHNREYGIWQVLDSVLTDNPTRVERDAKDDLRNRNELLSAFHKNKRNRDTELIAVDATEYKAFVQKVMKMAARYNIDMERELTKRQEIEAEARKAESQARIAESNVRLLELQIKMKQMETT